MYFIFTGGILNSDRDVLLYASVFGNYKAITEGAEPQFNTSVAVTVKSYETLDEAVQVLKDYYNCNVNTSQKSFCMGEGLFFIYPTNIISSLKDWRKTIQQRDMKLR